MDVKTFRARSIQEALQLVRAELGAHASVLHTREVRGGLWQRLTGARQIEVTASTSVTVPSRFAGVDEPPCGAGAAGDRRRPSPAAAVRGEAARLPLPPARDHDDSAPVRPDLQGRLDNLQALVEELCRRPATPAGHGLPAALFHVFTSLLDTDVGEELARELIDRLRQGAGPADPDDPALLQARIARLIESEIRVTGPVRVTPGRRRLVALVGPTGVGKTTTIAKLAAHFHLRQRCRVGLITVDTYRIAAVEQLRTYADIINLPMEVVATPRDMRQAVQRLADLDLILMDTAGRSPRDAVRIQELKTMLSEAGADEVHLVLSSVGSVESLKQTAQRFADVGVTALVLSKLDEATSLGTIVPLLRSCGLPLSYVTHGQNVPDDMEAADPRRLARSILKMKTVDAPW